MIPAGYQQGDTGMHGPMEKNAEETITNAAGKFRVPSTLKVTGLHLLVRARGFVPQYFDNVPGDHGEQVIRLMRGLTLRGRVVERDTRSRKSLLAPPGRDT